MIGLRFMTNENRKPVRKTVTLYDGGGWFIALFFGVPFLIVGVGIDYLWNYLVFSQIIKRLPFNDTNRTDSTSLYDHTSTKRIHIYCFIATLSCLLIDWLYYWQLLQLILVEPTFFPIKPLGWQRPLGVLPVLATILVPIVAIAVTNTALSYWLLHHNLKTTSKVGIAMGIFTAPWIIVGWVLFNFYITHP